MSDTEGVQGEVPVEPQIPEGEAPQETVEGQEPVESTAPQLSDEDYQLNFLGSDKFELAKETPEEVRAALKSLEKSLNKGWTEKNMKFAERQKEFVAQQQQIQQEIAAEREIIKDTAGITALQNAISEYDNVNWSAWAAQDATAAQRGFLELQALQQKLAKQQGEVESKKQALLAQQRQAAEAFVAESQQKLSTAIPDWSDEKRQTLTRFIGDSYLNSNPRADAMALQAISWHPGLVQMAHDAMLYRQTLQRASQSAKTSAPKPTPVAKVGGSAPAAVDPEKMSTEDWFKWRETDLANKRRAMNFNAKRR